jgi:hypothetical protein
MSAKKENGELSEQIARAAAERIAESMLQPSEAIYIVPIIEAAIAESARAQWLPIATAPKDGSPVLLFGRSDSGQRRAVGHYDAKPRPGGYGPWHWGITFQPTHWMPLPQPPKE